MAEMMVDMCASQQDGDDRKPDGESPEETFRLPVEIELYIEPDGSVIFADLAADVIPMAHSLNPGQLLACEPPQKDPAEDIDNEDSDG